MPNNTIGFGQAGVNNTNSFGRAASSTTNGFGAIHADSFGHDETNLIGSYADVFSLITRADSDSASVESKECLNNAYGDIVSV